MSEENFLVDVNSLIALYRQNCISNTVTSCLEKLSMATASGRIAILDLERNEIENSKITADDTDAFLDWLGRQTEQTGLKICKYDDDDIIFQYGKVINFVCGCEKYSDSSKRYWISGKAIGPWLIAASKARDYKIVTYETAIEHKYSKAKHMIRIPDVAAEFKVGTLSLFDMMSNLGIKV